MFLPLGTPMMRSDAARAFADAIASNHRDYKKWMLSSHIGLRAAMDLLYQNNEINIRTVSPDVYGIPFLQCSKLSRSVLTGGAWESFLICALENGYYLILNCDEFYIPERWCTKISHHTHSELIHGFDNEKRTFSVFGFSEKKQFETVSVAAGDLIQSIESSVNDSQKPFDADENCVLCVCVDPNRRYEINVSRLKKCIAQYLHSKNLLDDLWIYFGCEEGEYNASWADKYFRVYSRENILYGITCFDVFADWFDKNTVDNSVYYSPVNSLYSLLEHKSLMYDRLFFLNEYGSERNKAKLLTDRYRSEILGKCRLLLNLWLKYELNGRVKDFSTFSRYLMEIKTDEADILDAFLQLL